MSEQKGNKNGRCHYPYGRRLCQVVYRHCKKQNLWTIQMYVAAWLFNRMDLLFGKTFSVFWIRNLKNWDMRIFLCQCLFRKACCRRKKDHVEGFAPEVAWVTQCGDEVLQERMCVRPTSETLFCDYYAKVIHSYRDLPMLYNQWCSVVRWEKQPVRSCVLLNSIGRKVIPCMKPRKKLWLKQSKC